MKLFVKMLLIAIGHICAFFATPVSRYWGVFFAIKNPAASSGVFQSVGSIDRRKRRGIDPERFNTFGT
jgi:hypothetical protein